LKIKLTIIFVIEVPPFVYVQSQKIVNSVMASLEKEAKDVLEEGRNQAKRYDVEPEILFLEGNNIASIIIEHGEKNNFDLIVIGSKGKGKLKSSLLGSVSNKVIHHSKNPVYVVK
jgi:nucleotide-binding universal stress UspA family protein